MSLLSFTILGCGSSGGVPRIDGDWGDCDPTNPKNARTRCSLLVQRHGPEGVTNVIVDTSPDLRAHCLAHGVAHVDGVILTHDHADQTHGIDDLRAFAIRRRKRVPVWMDAATRDSLAVRFGYVFLGRGGYPAICDPMEVEVGRTLTVHGAGGPIDVRTFPQRHGAITSVGLRFGDVAYSPDVDGVPDDAWESLAGLDCWIVDALRWTPHPSHSHVDQTLDWIALAKPRRAILTNLHIDLDHDALAARLPGGVVPAYDGMKLTSVISDNLP